MLWPLLVVTVLLGHSHAQLTAQTSVAPQLRQCFENATLVNRNNLPPSTMAVLIDIIQQIEDNPSVNMNLRQTAAVLLHTYRQDGIQNHQDEGTTSSTGSVATVLPYSASFHSFYRHRLLLTKLIPNSLGILANTTLSSELTCALHYMLSTTVDGRQRSDESSCSQLAQYRALRIPRDLLRKIQYQYNPKDDVEFNDYSNLDTKSQRQIMISQCPILGGVVQTNWGAVSAGNIIAGIAAGAEAQQVALSEILKGGQLSSDLSSIQQYVTSLYPATLSGDLAEAALIQGTQATSNIQIGTSGGWNSTEAKRYYMLQSQTNLEMTGPEIRGGIDGFILGSTVTSALSTYSSLKLSQILDMYYSDRNGIFNTQLRACNRQLLRNQYITINTLLAETTAFSAALDTHIPLKATVTSGMQNLVTSAVSNFGTYSLNDVTCDGTTATATDYRLRTNLYIVLDASWPYDTVYPAVSHILDRIEIGKYGSSATILSAFDGSVVINKTFSPAHFHAEYTATKHQSLLVGVNLLTVYTNVHNLMMEELENEKTHNYVGGNSTVLLFLINTGNLQNNDQIYEQARQLNETVPDLRMLYATSSNQESNLWNLVRDMHNDIMTVTLTNNGVNLETNLNQLINRIRQVNRRVVSSACGSVWNSGTSSGTRQFDDFVEPGYINFYTVASNYFYYNNDNRKVRVTRSTGGTGSVIVCYSRQVTQPRQTNSTTENADTVTCQTLATNGNIEISLQNACDGYYTINTCPDLYISVQSDTAGTTSTTAVCTDTHLCRFPYDVRYQIQIEEFGCFSSGRCNIASFIIVLLSCAYALINKL